MAAAINTFFECEVLEEAPGKIGRGLFAEKDLKAGHLVIAEELQMRFGSMAEVTKESVKSKWNVMQRAGDPVELDLLELSHQANINASFEEKIHSICMSNCLETNVKRVEEITISYCALDAEVLRRQHFLNERYGFYCQCEACVWGTPFYQASQFRRQMIRVIGMDIKTTNWRNTQDGEAILQVIITTWENTVMMERALPFLWEVYAIGEFAARTNGFSLLSKMLGEKLYNIVVMHTGRKCDAFVDMVSRLDLFFPQKLNVTSRLA